MNRKIILLISLLLFGCNSTNFNFQFKTTDKEMLGFSFYYLEEKDIKSIYQESDRENVESFEFEIKTKGKKTYFNSNLSFNDKNKNVIHESEVEYFYLASNGLEKLISDKRFNKAKEFIITPEVPVEFRTIDSIYGNEINKLLFGYNHVFEHTGTDFNRLKINNSYFFNLYTYKTIKLYHWGLENYNFYCLTNFVKFEFDMGEYAF